MTSREDVLREALVWADNNMSRLARAFRPRFTPSSVSRWFSGQTRPDFVACLQLAEITHRSPDEVLEAFGHDASPLRVVRDSNTPPPRIPLSVQQRSLTANFERWMEVMGPRMGVQAAHDAYWNPLVRNSAQAVSTAEAVIDAVANPLESTAVSEAESGAVSDPVSGPQRPTNTPPDDPTGPLGICKTPPVVRLRELVAVN